MNLIAGKKTYLICAVAVVYAVSAYLTGNINFETLIQLLLTAGGGAALRNAVK